MEMKWKPQASSSSVPAPARSLDGNSIPAGGIDANPLTAHAAPVPGPQEALLFGRREE